MPVVRPVSAVIPIILEGDKRAGCGALFERRQSLVAHRLDDTRATVFVSRPAVITGWGQGADGELYLVASNGGLYHLV